MLNRIGALALAVVLATAVIARADEGNGQGSAQIRHTAAVIGGSLVVDWRSVTTPFAQTLLAASNELGPTTLTVLGEVCLDLNSPGASVVFDGLLDANGEATLTFAIPSNPSLVSGAPIYAVALVVDFSLPIPISLSRTTAIHLENRDGSSPLNSELGTPRSLHTATALAADDFDNEAEIFIAGGGDGDFFSPVASLTTEIFSPLRREFRSGPNLSEPRVLHAATRLQDGRVLVSGGADTAGNAIATCEIYDPVTETLSPVASMSKRRAGHCATLLDDGRVLVTGGHTNDAIVHLIPFEAVNRTGETFDPQTGLWTMANNMMSSPRVGHAQVKTNDGRVLITGGFDGADEISGFGLILQFTDTCESFVPNTNTFVSVDSLNTWRAGHGISVLSNGDVLVTGGFEFDDAATFSLQPRAMASCERWNGLNWSVVGPLPIGLALHTQVPSAKTGGALVIGGVTGLVWPTSFSVATSVVGRHDGVSFTSHASLGTNPGTAAVDSPRHIHTCTPLTDETFVVIGGRNDVSTSGTSLIFLEE